MLTRWVGDICIENASSDAPLDLDDTTPAIDVRLGECPVRLRVEFYGIILQRAVGKRQNVTVDGHGYTFFGRPLFVRAGAPTCAVSRRCRAASPPVNTMRTGSEFPGHYRAIWPENCGT